MNSPKVIGLMGYQRAGKTSVAHILRDNHQFAWTRFSAPVKTMLIHLGLSFEEVDGSLKNVPCEKLGGHTPVYAMQTLGTEWGRNLIHCDLWVNYWRYHVRNVLDRGKSVVVDDVRYPNELEAVKEFGGSIWEIDRPGVVRSSDHESESLVGSISPDLVIINNSDLATLEKDVALALEQV